MKKLGAVILHYLTILLSLTALILALHILTAITHTRILTEEAVALGLVVRQVPLLSLPLAVCFASIFSGYTLTRLFASRFWGYCILSILNWCILAGLFLLLHFIYPEFSFSAPGYLGQSLLNQLPGFLGLISFFDSMLQTSWPIGLGLLAAPALLFAACWPFTRLTRHRPLYGAFLGPIALLGCVYLISIYAAPGAEMVFAIINLELPLHFRTAILCGLTIPAIYLFDFVFAFKPQGRPTKGTNRA